jgi:hypothetical protein
MFIHTNTSIVSGRDNLGSRAATIFNYRLMKPCIASEAAAGAHRILGYQQSQTKRDETADEQ